MESPPQPTVPDSRQIDYLCKAYRQQLPVWELLEAIYASVNLRGLNRRGINPEPGRPQPHRPAGTDFSGAVLVGASLVEAKTRVFRKPGQLRLKPLISGF